jgi:hypothetical protein
VLDWVNDIPALEKMADRTYQHLVQSGRYGYRAFIHRLDVLLQKHLSRGLHIAKPPQPVAHAGNLIDEILVDAPTPVPGDSADYSFRNSFRLSQIYAAEADRLSREFAKYAGICLDGFNRLNGLRLSRRWRMAVEKIGFCGSYEERHSDIENLAFVRRYRGAQSFDKERLVRRSDLRAELERALRSDANITELIKLSFELHDHERNSCRFYQDLFPAFNLDYELEVSALGWPQIIFSKGYRKIRSLEGRSADRAFYISVGRGLLRLLKS